MVLLMVECDGIDLRGLLIVYVHVLMHLNLQRGGCGGHGERGRRGGGGDVDCGSRSSVVVI